MYNVIQSAYQGHAYSTEHVFVVLENLVLLGHVESEEAEYKTLGLL